MSTTKPQAHATLSMVNGRLVSKSLADPDVQEQLKQAVAKRFPDREAARRAMRQRGVLNNKGKLTKAYGG